MNVPIFQVLKFDINHEFLLTQKQISSFFKFHVNFFEADFFFVNFARSYFPENALIFRSSDFF
jgi:hypothetical protein